MSLFISSIVFLVSLIILLKSADYFTDAAERLGLIFKLPPFVVGITIVAIGTSLPELVSSIIAVINNQPGIVAGNAVGSNITNILLILGVTLLITAIKRSSITRVDLAALAGATLLLAFQMWDGSYSRIEAFIALFVFVLYLIYSFFIEPSHPHKQVSQELSDLGNKVSWPRPTIVLIVSGIFIYIGASYTVSAVINIAESLSLGVEIIAITAVALGTSLPELAVSARAATRNKSDLALGNILGSNLFNLLIVIPIPALLMPLTIPDSIISIGIPVMIVATVLYIVALVLHAPRWAGAILLLLYAIFISIIV